MNKYPIYLVIIILNYSIYITELIYFKEHQRLALDKDLLLNLTSFLLSCFIQQRCDSSYRSFDSSWSSSSVVARGETGLLTEAACLRLPGQTYEDSDIFVQLSK